MSGKVITRNDVGAKYKPTAAYVMFELDRALDILNIKNIKSFFPKSQFDFDNEVTVEALYTPKANEPKLDPEYFNARVLKLGLTAETLAAEIAKKRVPMPKILAEDVAELQDGNVKENFKLENDSKNKTESKQIKAEAKKAKEAVQKSKTYASSATLAAAKAKERREPIMCSSDDDEIMVNSSHLSKLEKKLSSLEGVSKKIDTLSNTVKDLKERVRYLEKKRKRSSDHEDPEDTKKLRTPESATTAASGDSTIHDDVKEKLDLDNLNQGDSIVEDHQHEAPTDQDTGPAIIDAKTGTTVDETGAPVDEGKTGSAVEDKPGPEVGPEVFKEPLQIKSAQDPAGLEEEVSAADEIILNKIEKFKVPPIKSYQEAKLKQLVHDNKKWIKELASIVFPKDLLMACSFDGNGSNRNGKLVVFPALPEAGKVFIMERYEKKLKDGGVHDVSVLGSVEDTVRTNINSKCSGCRRTVTVPKKK